MRIFSHLYDWVIRLARHPKAEAWLGVISFAESSFFPIPPDVMLAPMAIAQRERAWRLALITTITSVLGGLLGYLIGYFLIDLVMPLIVDLGWQPRYEQVVAWFLTYGFAATLIAGFTPIPFKLFTVAAGASLLPLPVFVVGSFLSRGARFYMVAGLCRWLGPVIETRVLRYIDVIGWSTLALLLIGGGVWYWLA